MIARRRWPILAVAAFLATVGVVASLAQSPRDAAAPCRAERFEGSRFTVCAYRKGQDRLGILLEADGRPLGGFRALRAALGMDAATVRFAMNGGMYQLNQAPVGLLIQDGRERHRADLSDGHGNFFLKPNGVFFVTADGSPHIEETTAFMAFPGRATWATQSGPLLLDDGRPHPAIAPDGTSLAIRNGVCTASPDEAFFVISDDKVSFGRLLRFMRDVLHCKDGLYLDGAVSSLWAPSLRRMDEREGLGPLIVVSRPNLAAISAP